MKQSRLLPLIFCMVSACSHKTINSETNPIKSAEPLTEPAKAAADEEKSDSCSLATHGEREYPSDYPHIGEAIKIKYQDQNISRYKNYFFAQLAPEKLTEFIQLNSIQMLIDLRSDGSDADLSSQFPAVYWHHSLEKPEDFNHKSVQELEDHLEAFSNKSIIFVSHEGDVAVAAFTKYWAAVHALNEAWVSKISNELGLKDHSWLKKWDELERGPASEK